MWTVSPWAINHYYNKIFVKCVWLKTVHGTLVKYMVVIGRNKMNEFHFLWWWQIYGLRHRLAVQFALQTLPKPNTEYTVNWYRFFFHFGREKKQKRNKLNISSTCRWLDPGNHLLLSFEQNLPFFFCPERIEFCQWLMVVGLLISCHFKCFNQINCKCMIVL